MDIMGRLGEYKQPESFYNLYIDSLKGDIDDIHV